MLSPYPFFGDSWPPLKAKLFHHYVIMWLCYWEANVLPLCSSKCSPSIVSSILCLVLKCFRTSNLWSHYVHQSTLGCECYAWLLNVMSDLGEQCSNISFIDAADTYSHHLEDDTSCLPCAVGSRLIHTQRAVTCSTVTAFWDVIVHMDPIIHPSSPNTRCELQWNWGRAIATPALMLLLWIRIPRGPGVHARPPRDYAIQKILSSCIWGML